MRRILYSGIAVIAVFSSFLVSAPVAAAEGNNSGALILPITVGGNDIAEPYDGKPPSDPPPSKPWPCTDVTTSVPVLNPDGTQKYDTQIPPQPVMEDKTECKINVGSIQEETVSGTSLFPSDSVLRSSGSDVRASLPLNMPDGGANYNNECQKEIQYVNTLGWEAWYSASAVHWTKYITYQVRPSLEITQSVTVNYGGCTWPTVTHYVNTCPYSISNGQIQGPMGDGIPVQIGPNEYDPITIKETKPLKPFIKYSNLGAALNNGSWDSKSDAAKASLVANCEENIASTYEYTPEHPGNYIITGDGATITCNYLEFRGQRHFGKCANPDFFSASQLGWVDCDRNLTREVWAPEGYDFSCRIPVENRVCTTSDPDCPTSVIVPEPVDDPKNPPILIPSPLPGADTIVCLWDYPTVEHPQGGGDNPFLNKVTTVGANGRPWELNWGDMQVLNAPGVEGKWTNYYVETGSTPGKETEDASSHLQPFNGTYNKIRVLMWDDADLNDTGEGIDGENWARTLTMNWYQAGMEGINEYSLFTVYQQRHFVWQRTLPTWNWDGSPGEPIMNLIPQTCESPSASFIVVGGRNTSGNIAGR